MSVTLTYSYKPFNVFDADNGCVTNTVAPGIVGINGQKGEDGKSIYLSDFNPSNTYSKNIMLQKIDNNMALSNDSNVKIENRTFKKGDWVVCSDRSVYMLDDPEENSQFKFDLKYVGRFSATDDEEGKLAAAIGGVSLNMDASIREYPAPTNRSFAKSMYNICIILKVPKIDRDDLHDLIFTYRGEDQIILLTEHQLKHFCPSTSEEESDIEPGELYYNTYGQIDSKGNSFKLYLGNGDLAIGFALTQLGPNISSDVEEPSHTTWQQILGDYSTIDYYVLRESELVKLVIRTSNRNFIERTKMYISHYTPGQPLSDPLSVTYKGQELIQYVSYDEFSPFTDNTLQTSVSYDKAERDLYGLHLTPTIISDASIDSSSLTDVYDCFLNIYVVNEKCYSYNTYLASVPKTSKTQEVDFPADPVYKNAMFNFYKKITIPLNGQPMFLSDMSMDKIGLTRNAYLSCYFSDVLNKTTTPAKLINGDFWFNYSSDGTQYNCVGSPSNDRRYMYNKSFDIWEKSRYQENFPFAAYTYKDGMLFYRGGESAMFSTIDCANGWGATTDIRTYTYDDMIQNQNLLNSVYETDPTQLTINKNKAKGYVAQAIHDIIFNENNKYEIMCVNKVKNKVVTFEIKRSQIS